MAGAELIALQKNRYWLRADGLSLDAGGAPNAGLQAILARTGKYREERVRQSGIQPTAVVDSIADVPSRLGR